MFKKILFFLLSLFKKSGLFLLTLLKKLYANRVNIAAILVLATLLAITLYNALPEFFARLAYELKEVTNWDTGLYYTVGKGLSNGIPLYSGLYENKPPMIFLLSALSYSLTEGFYSLNILSFLCFIIIASLPTFLVIYKGVKEKRNPILTISLSLFSLCISLLLANYAESKAGEVQTEAFGAVALFFSIFSMSVGKSENSKIYSPYIIASGTFLGMATMFKEPFGIIGFITLLFFIQKPKDILYKVIYPTLYAILFFVLLLLVTKSFIPYFTIYLSNMFGSHISIYGSPFERSLNIFKLFYNLGRYTKVLEILIYTLITINILFYISKIEQSSRLSQKIINFLKIPLIFVALYTSSFNVGLGGQYFSHHYIFALPFYGFLLFNAINLCIENPNQEKTLQYTFIFSIITAIITSIAFSNIDPFKGINNIPKDIKHAKENAAYIDEILDILKEDKYQYLGFNGIHAYTYTKHDPLGPAFAQDEHNFTDQYSYFSQAFAKQMNTANVIVFKSFNVGVLNGKTKLTLNSCFTKELPYLAQHLKKPKHFHYTMYFRIKKDCNYYNY